MERRRRRHVSSALQPSVQVYLSEAVTLRFLDILQNNPDKRAIKSIAAALGNISPSLPTSSTDTPTSAPTVEFNFESPLAPSKPSKPNLVTLRIDGCNLRCPSLELLAQAVRNSPLQHISLRNNRISSQSAVALSIMAKDYPDAIGQSVQRVRHHPVPRFKANRLLSLAPQLVQIPICVITCGFGGSAGDNQPDCSSNHPTWSHDSHRTSPV